MLFGVMPADETAGARTQQPVIAGVMAGDTTDDGTFDAAGSIRRGRRKPHAAIVRTATTAIDFIPIPFRYALVEHSRSAACSCAA